MSLRSSFDDVLANPAVHLPLLALSFLLVISPVLHSCAAQKPACTVIKLADEACIWVEGRDGVRVQVPAAELHRVALEAKMRADAAPSASASAGPVGLKAPK